LNLDACLYISGIIMSAVHLSRNLNPNIKCTVIDAINYAETKLSRLILETVMELSDSVKMNNSRALIILDPHIQTTLG